MYRLSDTLLPEPRSEPSRAEPRRADRFSPSIYCYWLLTTRGTQIRLAASHPAAAGSRCGASKSLPRAREEHIGSLDVIVFDTMWQFDFIFPIPLAVRRSAGGARLRARFHRRCSGGSDHFARSPVQNLSHFQRLFPRRTIINLCLNATRDRRSQCANEQKAAAQRLATSIVRRYARMFDGTRAKNSSARF